MPQVSLNFREASCAIAKPGQEILPSLDEQGVFYTLEDTPVVTGEELAKYPISKRSPDVWTLMDKLRASYNPQRSGDFLVVLKPRVTPIPESGMGYVATHGSVWDYDRRVPILFWRKGLTGFEQPNAVMTVDILPTLASVIGVPLDAGKIDGRCLDLLSGPESSCR